MKIKVKLNKGSEKNLGHYFRIPNYIKNSSVLRQSATQKKKGV